MSSDTKKTDVIESASNKPRLISEGILMYPERLDLKEETIAQIARGSYVITLGNQSFVVTISERKKYW